MEWLSSANTIASLLLALFGIGGYLYGIVTYLKKKASPQQQDSGSAQTSTSSTPQAPVSYRKITWLEWIELFAQGLVDMADFVIDLFFPKERYSEKETTINKIGLCAMICGFGVILGEIILGIAIGVFLGFMGMKDAAGVAVGISTVLLFMTFSLVYIYHVGLAVEIKQLKEYQEIKRHQ
jgi:hypothetical protein